MNFDMDMISDPQTIAIVLISAAAFATILTMALPLVSGSKLQKRMRQVATEREAIRAREREKLNAGKGLRQQPKAYMKRVVDQFNLSRWLGTEQAKGRMLMAGYRGPQAETAFLFFRLVSPLVFMVLGAFYIFAILNIDWAFTMKLGMVVFCTYIGIKAPELYISNSIKKRQVSILRAFPDALDLMLICVESGMSIEAAFRKVSQEIGLQSIPLAEELTLTTAELSYLPERRAAYENLGLRTGVESVKGVVTVLIQAERYGTPLGHALRILGQESREHRMLLAEQKAAALPPKLTVPMIIFFLPVLFAVILTPAILQISHMM